MEHIRGAVPRRRRSRATAGGAGEGGTSLMDPKNSTHGGSECPQAPQWGHSLSWVQGEVAQGDPRGDGDMGTSESLPKQPPLG